MMVLIHIHLKMLKMIFVTNTQSMELPELCLKKKGKIFT